ncbi:MAG: hypothetical protein HYV27_24255 [Candidatus Hydrogenedentes bacterium]|nr:hypothetical protein [Candidatus Hydrogenedentota bacterium]
MTDALVLDLDTAQGEMDCPELTFLECDPELVERSLFSAIRGSNHEMAYHAAREACYREPDWEVRDRAFVQLDRDWFVRLDLARPAIEACGEWKAIMSRVRRCILAPCIRRQDECAELYGQHYRAAGGGEKPSLIIRLHPDSFCRPGHVQILLRHELMHINDMLDPRFDYDPSLSQFYDETGIPNAIRDRYRILWDVYIDGRLCAKYNTAHETRTQRIREFGMLFRVLGTRSLDAFNWIFEASTLTHQEILAFARTPLSFFQQLDSERR